MISIYMDIIWIFYIKKKIFNSYIKKRKKKKFYTLQLILTSLNLTENNI